MSFQTKHAPNRSLPDSQSGFTLIELIITITIFGILLAIAIPNLTSLVRNQRIKAATGDVYATLIFARSEAIKRNADVSVCQASGLPDGWAGGWSIKTPDCIGTELKKQDTIAGINILQKDGTPVGNLTFQRDGRLTASLPPPAGGIVVKSSDDLTMKARCIILDLGGRPNIKADTDNDSTNGC